MKTTGIMRTTILLLCSALLAAESMAAETSDAGNAGNIPAISYDPGRKVFLLQTAHSSYAFGLASDKTFVNLHWGGRLASIHDVPEPGKRTTLVSRTGSPTCVTVDLSIQPIREAISSSLA